MTANQLHGFISPRRTLLTMKEATIGTTPMLSRFMIAATVFLFVVSSAVHGCYAQQVMSDVAISGAGLNDGYLNGGQCDSQGNLYRERNHSRRTSVMRVAWNGSTVVFATPDNEELSAVAPDRLGVTLLSSSFSDRQGVSRYIYRFDLQGRLISQNQVFLDFSPSKIAITSSGKIVAVGYRPQDEAKKPMGAVLEADGQVAHLFEFPPTNVEWAWGLIRESNGLTYFIPNSQTEAIYSISESGRINIIPVAPTSGTRVHKWLFGEGVAVKEYDFPSEKGSHATWFDIYDLGTGKRIGKKSLPKGMGFTTACYLGDAVSWLALGGQGSQELRLVTVKLKNDN